ncbi:MAG: Cytidylate kinase [Microgenomates group bacterium GW2011_GWC1_49_7]|nr:MAG: Cytidylate kinase [Microgenomates group bacterium GW2011_GWC1_49_7]
MKKPLQIAIDGPVGAGKSDISKALAKALGITFVYTGAMYRALTHECLCRDVLFTHTPDIIGVLNSMDIELTPPPPGSKYVVQVLVNGKDVTSHLFEPIVDGAVPEISKIPEVRRIMVERQKHIAAAKNVVMEGRDIALRVLPNAQMKIYLTAPLEERARRRWAQLKAQGIMKSFAEVIENTKLRDIQDTTRKTDPLVKAPDAWEYDTDGNTVEKSVEDIKREIKRRGLI